MRRQLGRAVGILILAAALAVLVWPGARAAEPVNQQEPVRIGMIGSLFRDVPESAMLGLMTPFAALMESQTGVTGQLIPVMDPTSLGNQLAEDKVHLAVFHGIEFAWARQRFPDIRPLMIAVNEDRHLRALLVVRRDASVMGLADVKGKAVALPRGAREHCHVFLNHGCIKAGTEMQKYFAKLTNPANSEVALDDVVDGLVDAAVVDSLAYDSFKRRKPGRFARLKVAEQSEVFPAAVIAYRPGCIDVVRLQRFRDGMINANQTTLGRKLLTLWKLTGFEPIPPDYEQTLTRIVQAYPQPLLVGR